MEPLVTSLEKYRPALVIVDSLKSITKNLTVSENSPEFANFVYKLKEVFSAYGCAAVLIHHISKNREHSGVNKLRGSTAIAGSAWGIWLLDRTGENSVTLECISRDIEGETIPIALNQETMQWERQGSPPPTEGALTEKIVTLLQTRTNSHTGLEVAEIKEALGVEGKYLYIALIRLCEKRIIGKRESRLNKGKSVYFLPEPTLVNRECTQKSYHTYLQVNNHRTSDMITPPVITSYHSHHSESSLITNDNSPSYHALTPSPPGFEAPMMTNSPTPPIRESQQTPSIENVSTSQQNEGENNSSTQVCRKNQGYIPCVGDWVRYVGANQVLRFQCGHAKKHGLRVIALDGQTAIIKSPHWVVDYQVAFPDLMPDRSERRSLAQVSGEVEGGDDDAPI